MQQQQLTNTDHLTWRCLSQRAPQLPYATTGSWWFSPSSMYCLSGYGSMVAALNEVMVMGLLPCDEQPGQSSITLQVHAASTQCSPCRKAPSGICTLHPTGRCLHPGLSHAHQLLVQHIHHIGHSSEVAAPVQHVLGHCLTATSSCKGRGVSEVMRHA